MVGSPKGCCGVLTLGVVEPPPEPKALLVVIAPKAGGTPPLSPPRAPNSQGVVGDPKGCCGVLTLGVEGASQKLKAVLVTPKAGGTPSLVTPRAPNSQGVVWTAEGSGMVLSTQSVVEAPPKLKSLLGVVPKAEGKTPPLVPPTGSDSFWWPDSQVVVDALKGWGGVGTLGVLEPPPKTEALMAVPNSALCVPNNGLFTVNFLPDIYVPVVITNKEDTRLNTKMLVPCNVDTFGRLV